MVKLNIKTLVKKIVQLNFAFLFVMSTFLSSGFMLIIENEKAGAATVRDTSSGFVANASSTFTVTTPSSTVSGDLLILFMHHGRGDIDIESDWGQTGSNWTFERAEALDPGTSNESASVWYRTATSGDAGGSGSYNFIVSVGADALRWVMVAVQDHNGFDLSEGYHDTDVTTSPSVSDSIDPTNSGALLLAFLAKDDNDGQTTASWTSGQSLTNEASYNNEGSVLYTSVFSETLSGSGAVTRDFTLSGTNIDGTAKQIMVTINPAAAASSTQIVPSLSQDGFIFENDDGVNADSNSQQAAGNTAINGVRKGENVNLRMQLSNSEAALDSELGLFYQKDGGFWTQVRYGNSSLAESINDGLIGHWKFDGDATDSTPFGNDGTVSGAVLSTDRFGRANSAYDFDGSNDVITTTNGEMPDEFSISSWINMDTLGGSRVAVSNSRDCCENFRRGFNLLPRYNNPRINLWRIDGAGAINATGPSELSASTWYHLTGTYDGETLRLYIDGVEVDATEYSQANNGTPSSNLTIGKLGIRDDLWFDGRIDDVRYYNRALTSNEVNYLYGYDECTNTSFTCQTIDNNMAVFDHVNAAINPGTNVPWAVYESDSFDLGVARYVGKGGNGCNGGNSVWSCEIIDDLSGTHPSIAFSSGGKAWVSYSGSGSDLYVAEYVGSGGTGCSGGNTAWTCTELLEGTFESTDIAVDDNGVPWITAVNEPNGDVYVIERVGSGGSGCFSGAVFNCVVLDNDVGTADREVSTTAIVIDDTNNPNVLYEDESSATAELVHAVFVGTSGTGCTSTAWTCVNVATSSNSTNYLDAAIAPDGSIWISYHDSDLVVANYVGSGGNCDTNKSGSDAWNCTDVDTTGATTGQATSIAFDPGGQAFVSYHDLNTSGVAYARYVGTGGSGCANTAWDGCGLLQDGANDNGEYTSVAIDGSGTIWVFYTTETANDLEVAVSKTSYFISPANSVVSNGLSSLTESHVDMTSVTDSSNRDDADCIASGGSWNNGLFSSNGLTNLSLPDGSTTVQCSEITFGIGTGNAVDGSYRFALAFRDRTKSGKSFWRGMAQISQYPTMTIQDEPGIRFTKGTTPIFSSCSGGNGEWGCDTIAINSGSIGRYSSIIVDNEGVAWATIYSDSTDGFFAVAKYVGSGGNCDSLWTGGSDRWDCEVVYDESSIDDGPFTSAAINPITNKPSFTFTASTEGSTAKIVIADYVGSGGSGCTGGSTAYNCTVIMNPGFTGFGEGTSLQFSHSGTPYVAFRESSNNDIWFAKYVGEGGNCDNDYSGSDAWSCEEILTTDDAGPIAKLVIDSDGVPWIATGLKFAPDSLMVAKYVGSGGANCGNTSWQCWIVTDGVNLSNATESDVDITVDKNNTIWVAYQDDSTVDFTLRVAQFVGSGGTGCDDTAWTCTLVDSDSGVDVGDNVAIGTDKSGNPIIAYQNSGVSGTFNDVKVTRFVGSGGTGCTSTAWDGCETAYAKNGIGRDINMTVDDNGLAWIVSRDETSDYLQLIKQNVLLNTLYTTNDNVSQNSNVANAADLLFVIADGRSARSLLNGGCGSALANMMGYCGMLENDGSYDSITAAANERPYVAASVGFTSNTEMPLVNWTGRTNVAPSTSGTAADLQLQIYRYGTTNSWETLASDTASTNCNTADCDLSGSATGPPSEYFREEDGVYWFAVRVYQVESSSSMTLRTDELSATITGQRLRTGRSFEGGAPRPFVTE